MSAVSEFVIDMDVVQEEEVYQVYLLARANKRKSEDAVIFEINQERNIHNLTYEINERTYRANGNYTFISLRPQPREVFGCELEARLVQWYFITKTAAVFEKVLTKRTFNNRIGMGTQAAVDRFHKDIIAVSHNFTRDAWIIQWDLTGYFPNANCDCAYDIVKRVLDEEYDGDDKDVLLWMAMISIHANPQAHCYKKSSPEMWATIPKHKSILAKPPGIGGAIGFLIWQVVMNLYLNDVDVWAVYECGLHYVRFVDDSAMVVEDKEAALAMLPLFREKYAAVGAQMHPKKFYCQHVTKGMRFLGTYIKYERQYVDNRVIRNALRRIREFNACFNKYNHIQEFLSSINASIGLMKHKQEFGNIMFLWSKINKDWKKYVDFDYDRVCVVARSEYSYHKIMNRKFRRITNGRF